MKTSPRFLLLLHLALLALAPSKSEAFYVHVTTLNLGPPGILTMHLGGTLRSSPSTGTTGVYDAVDVDNNAQLDGTFRLLLINGFTPAPGDSFDLINWGTKAGSPSFDLPAIDPGLFWHTEQFTNDGTVSVSTTAAPEPGGAALLFGSAVQLFALRRRRAAAV